MSDDPTGMQPWSPDPTAPTPWAPQPQSAPVPYQAPAPAPASYGGADPILLSIGDIGVSRYWVITPNGSAPLGGSQWIVSDMSRTEERMPAYAIVLAILFFLACLLGLLFLLIKERKTTGYVEVSVRTGDLYHATQLPVSNPQQVLYYRQLVHQAQSMAAAAR